MNKQITLELLHSRIAELEGRVDLIRSGSSRVNSENYDSFRKIERSIQDLYVQVDRVRWKVFGFGDDGGKNGRGV